MTTNSCRWCGGEKRFDPTASTTYQKVGDETVELAYGSGDAWGDHIQETVCLTTDEDCEGFFCESVCVTNMNLLGVTG